MQDFSWTTVRIFKQTKSNEITSNNLNEMFHNFDHYGNVNCVFTRVYALLSYKYKGINSLATISDGLSFNIDGDSFNFKWKKEEESAWWLFWWQCFLMEVAFLSLYFDDFSVITNFPKFSYWRTGRWRFVSPT